ncbi:MAG: ankyrin repeat domain-containing protein [Planctomycetales bacterium]|nr:ankyrin repeat domain-containing protein [Planctomycetales bacterium]
MLHFASVSMPMKGILCIVAIVVACSSALSNELSSALVTAAEKGETSEVNRLLANGADANDSHPDGMTALHWSVYHDDLESVRQLISAKVKVDAANRYGVQPLSIACKNGNAEIVELLANSGADANATLRGGETALMTAARSGRVQCVKSLIAHGADVNAKDRKGQTAFMWAAADGNIEVVKELLAAGADYKSPLKSGFTPFFFAVRQGHADVVLELLSHGIDVNAGMKASSGSLNRMPPLLLAVENGHFELAAKLLDSGADPNGRYRGYTSLHAITWVRKPIRGDGDPPPAGSGTLTSSDLVRKLIASGADVNSRHGKRPKDQHGRLDKSDATPFLLASETGDIALMNLLIELNADPTLVNSDNCTPLLAAAGVGILGNGDESAGTEEDAIAAIEFLLGLGADINAVEANGETAMHGAAYKSWTKLIAYLSDHNADAQVWNQDNRRGWTPLKIAQGHRPGNFRYSAETVVAVEAAMRSAGVE